MFGSEDALVQLDVSEFKEEAQFLSFPGRDRLQVYPARWQLESRCTSPVHYKTHAQYGRQEGGSEAKDQVKSYCAPAFPFSVTFAFFLQRRDKKFRREKAARANRQESLSHAQVL